MQWAGAAAKVWARSRSGPPIPPWFEAGRLAPLCPQLVGLSLFRVFRALGSGLATARGGLTGCGLRLRQRCGADGNLHDSFHPVCRGLAGTCMFTAGCRVMDLAQVCSLAVGQKAESSPGGVHKEALQAS